MTEQPSVIERLIKVWDSGKNPELRDFVAEQDSLTHHELVALVSEDQRLRWARGERRLTEEYRDHFAELAQGPVVLDVIYAEFILREDLGEVPDEAEYLQRFPEYAEAISRQLQLHRALSGSVPGTGRRHTTATSGELPTIDGFDVIEIAGRGGMGVVYRARDLLLNRTVAIKTLRAGSTSDDEETRRLIREAEAAARLQHPGIVQIHHVGESGGLPFLVMQFVEGRTLAEAIRSGPLSERQAVRITTEIADAICDAHRHSVIHRDLKPGNVLLDENGTARVTDFGLSRRIDSTLTVESAAQVVGTPAYMAPEQARGQSVSETADIYAIGAMLYEMLTGRPPFQAATPWDVVTQILTHDPPRLRELNNALPRDLETICERCLQKSPENRYQSAEALKDDLTRFAQGRPIAARPVSPIERAVRWCRRNPRFAAAAGLAAALSIALTVVTTVAVIRINESAAEARASRAEAVQAKVSALLQAAPDAVPFAITDLKPVSTQALPLLRDAVRDPNSEPAARLHAACGLMAHGDSHVETVLECAAAVPASPGECRNVAQALRHGGSGALQQLGQLARSGSDQQTVRLAIVGLFLGEPETAERLLEFRKDPRLRTALEQTFADWYGDPAALADVLEGDLSAELRTSLCIAMGSIDPRTLVSPDRGRLEEVLLKLHRVAPDGGTHSATRWTLDRWEVPLPDADRGESWFRNAAGHVMVRIESGEFEMGSQEFHREPNQPTHHVTITRPVYFSSHETTREQFGRYLDSLADDENENGVSSDELISPTTAHPVQNVFFGDAVRYCNWLSELTGRTPCYQYTGERWECDFAADGYRLPTEAEWEFACRAGSQTRFHFGDDETLLPQYARTSNFRKVAAFEPGSLRPNPWGLFDMYGNVWEWSWDVYSSLSGEPVTDPAGPTDRSDAMRVIRGGGVDNRAGDPDSTARGSMNIEWRAWNLGFRVVCNATR